MFAFVCELKSKTSIVIVLSKQKWEIVDLYEMISLNFNPIHNYVKTELFYDCIVKCTLSTWNLTHVDIKQNLWKVVAVGKPFVFKMLLEECEHHRLWKLCKKQNCKRFIFSSVVRWFICMTLININGTYLPHFLWAGCEVNGSLPIVSSGLWINH